MNNRPQSIAFAEELCKLIVIYKYLFRQQAGFEGWACGQRDDRFPYSCSKNNAHDLIVNKLPFSSIEAIKGLMKVFCKVSMARKFTKAFMAS